MTFLKAQGIRGLVGKKDWPRYTEEEPEIYEQAELDKLFAACDSEERLNRMSLRLNGEREQEVMYSKGCYHGKLDGVFGRIGTEPVFVPIRRLRIFLLLASLIPRRQLNSA